jgi:hypothetical protein
MRSLHDTFSRPSGPGAPRPGRRRRAAAGAAVLLAVLGPVPASGPARAAARGDRLLPGETLQAGQSVTAGRDALTMQGDGNLVLIAPGSTPVWASHTAGNSGASLVMQPGGDLVIVAPGGRALWSAGTARHPGSMLILRPDGNLVVNAPDSTPPGSTTLWSTGTSRQTYADIQLAVHGWGRDQARQFGCLDDIWTRESKWNELAGNPAGAYGIPQASPGAKMAAAGQDWLTDPRTQIRWGEDYIQGQYGTPCQAWAYWQGHASY